MSSSESNWNARAFRSWQQESRTAAGWPHPSVHSSAAPGTGERGHVRRGGRSPGLWWELCKADRMGLLCALAPWDISESFYTGGGGGLRLHHLCCFFPCMIAFYFHWVYFSLLVALQKRIQHSWRSFFTPISFPTPGFSLSIETKSCLKHFIALLSWVCASPRRFTF